MESIYDYNEWVDYINGLLREYGFDCRCKIIVIEDDTMFEYTNILGGQLIYVMDVFGEDVTFEHYIEYDRMENVTVIEFIEDKAKEYMKGEFGLGL